MRLPKYSLYKDSGVAWLGKVPQHWEILSLKRIATLKSGESITAQNIEEEGAYPVYGGNGLRGFTTSFTHDGRFALIGRQGALCGNVNYSSGKFWASEHAVVATPIRVVSTTWLGELLRAMNLNQYSVSAAQPGLSVEIISNLGVPYPPIDEQFTIATFLDREVGKIDTLISEQEKLLTLLAEKRRATISHAVTRGLNTSAQMKDTGVAWLGEVPAHWETLATKRLFRLVAEPAPDDNDEELLSIYTDIGVRPRKSLEERGNKATTTDGYWIVRKGDIIVNKLLAWMGAIGLSNYDGVTSPAYDILRQTKSLNPQYYDYLFRCGVMFTEFRRHSRGIMDMRLRLYFEDFGQIYVPFPSEEEQTEIVRFLQSETAKLDALSAHAEGAIGLLKERRGALIAAAVTGKIDVRNAVPEELAA
ncbi:putative restriction endonuclease S subunit [Cupriavidus taiwanensis]|uniref:restriction endonuclease subunit S n=1 Tax=Cupriavidus taiwanensis TaxID=164546 RepID=UPI000E1ACDC6|nr:restriction endonuclease subunit S [Cupriavidus taiwanensis]SPA23704.1 putative restriction endonuclease S subunit [Cupriavidus taiwanensis]